MRNLDWMTLCRPLVEHFEGCVLKAYWDSAGQCWTIGWGTTGPDIVSGLVWTQEEADARLTARLLVFGAMADKAIINTVVAQQKAAFVSILYNVGPGRAASAGDAGRDGIITLASGAPSTLLQKLNAGDINGCADQFLAWNKAGGSVLAGLVTRRSAERSLFLTGKWSVP